MRKMSILLLAMVFTLALSTSINSVHAELILTNLYVSAQSNVILAGSGGSTYYQISSRWFIYQLDPSDYTEADLSITNWYPSMPVGVTATFNTTQLHALANSTQNNEYIGGTNATLHISTSGSTPPGTYTFTVQLHQPYHANKQTNGTLNVIRLFKGGLWKAEENLMAGQHIAAGQLLMYDTDRFLVVSFQAKPNWQITETHLAIATSLDDIPQTKKGNPIPGQFQYKNDTIDSVESYQYRIPMTWPSGTTLYIAAHCVVEGVGEFCGQTESAWAGNLPFPGRNWANYTIYFTEYTVYPPVRL